MAKAPPRTVRLERLPTADEPGVVVITIGRTSGRYVFLEIPCEIGGRGFIMHPQGLGNLYHVRIGTPADTSCECLGFYRHGHCKHTAALKALFGKFTPAPKP
jgi:hypothetical protein